MTQFPDSPFAGHVFIENPADGSMIHELSLADWTVVVQRDGTIRGPRPVGRYRLRHLGAPSDVIGLHVIDVQPQSEKDRYERMESDVLVAPDKEAEKRQTKDQGAEKKEAKEDDPFMKAVRTVGIVGALGAFAIGMAADFIHKLEQDD